MAKKQIDKTYLFERAPVRRAVIELAVPTIISQIISLVYNMADTFFVGRLGDPNQVAAVSLAAPMMLSLTALANLFGIGAASLASRSLGAKDTETAKRATAFGFYAALIVAALLSLSALSFKGFFLDILGASGDMRVFTGDYMFWVFTVGAIPSLLSMISAHFIRADGAPRVAGLGLSAGGLINLVLDPIFIFDFGLGMGVKGAAFATFISNMITFIYFMRYFYINRKTTCAGLSPSMFSLKADISRPVLTIGLPSMLQTLLASVSNAMLNRLAAPFEGAAVAGLGIVKKVDTIPMSITIGISQGVMPMLGFNHSAGTAARMKEAAKMALVLSVGFSLICVAVFEIFPASVVKLFINDAQTVTYGAFFLRIMCVSTPMMAVGFLMITLFQAVGESKPALILSVLRKGVVDIPLMLLINLLIPLYGLAFVQPATELTAMVAAVVLYLRFLRKKAGPDVNTKI
ncbi:MAG: MATE family efflux transporter [Oscillospiraceae bacterium]|nr:MATE family efflux transporter [Oscillospiraceae bacterium]